MRFNSLQEWLAWQETLHPNAIDLGLERVNAVLRRLGRQSPPYAVITVAGTNGKGSAVAMLHAILAAAGHRVGMYTSPHLLRYNERIRVNGAEVGDDALVQAFDRIDRARGDISLTYFEFGTLAAIEIFAAAGIDVAVMEVGLGGRLDAVNVLDADAALVTTVDIDHTGWLGDNREAIGQEKAGIFRAGRSAVYGDSDPPASLCAHAAALGLALYCFQRDFNYSLQGLSWTWDGPGRRRPALPLPRLRGTVQLRNASAVLMVLELLATRLPVTQGAVREGLLEATLPGRFQVIAGDVTQILDVAHNPQAATVLANNLSQLACAGRTHALVGMLADKDIEGVLRGVRPAIDVWHVAGLDVARGAPAERLIAALQAIGIRDNVHRYTDVASAWPDVWQRLAPGDRLVVFGSFYTVAAAMREQERIA
ncbi:MAG: dihydrofolate synthase / folylpolyglutamate synthase [Gammaproteobacteria bacterium]|nr:MAG: dihydrofolate synthase / folylpolyglutamate synthase [Gammaproteobacteria bacterium]TND07394.1 MAG: dihydrofolate synthase / folylpolyglutamate synthase [Gammaproteobacteria bacterium]